MFEGGYPLTFQNGSGYKLEVRCPVLSAKEQVVLQVVAKLEEVYRTEGALRSTTKHIPGAPESISRYYYLFILLTFVWLFGALVSMRAIDYDLQEFFWDLTVHGKVFKKYFMSVLARGMVDLTLNLILDPGNLTFAGTLD